MAVARKGAPVKRFRRAAPSGRDRAQCPLKTIARFAGQRVLVIGDLMLDEFLWGKVSRISPEAPVPVVEVSGESYYPGGAANVARNLREFTDRVSVMGVAGADSYGDRLLRAARRKRYRFLRRAAAAGRRHHREDARSLPAISRWCGWTANVRRR